MKCYYEIIIKKMTSHNNNLVIIPSLCGFPSSINTTFVEKIQKNTNNKNVIICSLKMEQIMYNDDSFTSSVSDNINITIRDLIMNICKRTTIPLILMTFGTSSAFVKHALIQMRNTLEIRVIIGVIFVGQLQRSTISSHNKCFNFKKKDTKDDINVINYMNGTDIAYSKLVSKKLKTITFPSCTSDMFDNIKHSIVGKSGVLRNVLRHHDQKVNNDAYDHKCVHNMINISNGEVSNIIPLNFIRDIDWTSEDMYSCDVLNAKSLIAYLVTICDQRLKLKTKILRPENKIKNKNNEFNFTIWINNDDIINRTIFLYKGRLDKLFYIRRHQPIMYIENIENIIKSLKIILEKIVSKNSFLNNKINILIHSDLVTCDIVNSVIKLLYPDIYTTTYSNFFNDNVWNKLDFSNFYLNIHHSVERYKKNLTEYFKSTEDNIFNKTVLLDKSYEVLFNNLTCKDSDIKSNQYCYSKKNIILSETLNIFSDSIIKHRNTTNNVILPLMLLLKEKRKALNDLIRNCEDKTSLIKISSNITSIIIAYDIDINRVKND